MNREFVGNKKFYLEDHPDTYVIARLYVIETRQNEYMTAVPDNGDAFQIETFEGPSEEPMKYFMDLDNRRFCEYPILTISNIRFFDRRSEEIGIGEVSMMKVGTQRYYMGGVTPVRSFKYKKSGWDFIAKCGDEIVVSMTKSTRNNIIMPLIAHVFAKNNTVETECLENKKFQIWCSVPEEFNN